MNSWQSWKSWWLACSLAVCSGVLGAQTTPRTSATDAQQQIKQLERAEAALDRLRALSDSIAAEKKYACMATVGHESFCACMSGALPIRVTFEAYVQIVAMGPLKDTDLATLSKDDREALAQMFTARDTCVAKSFPLAPTRKP